MSGARAGGAMIETCYRGLDPFIRMFARSEGARTIEQDGALSSVVPAIPMASLFNATIFDRARPETLGPALEAAEASYRGEGITAWGAWIIEGDAAAERIAAAHGLKVDSVPRAMGAELSALDLSADTSAVAERWDMPVAARLNELGYRVPDGLFAPMSPVGRPEGARCFIAEEDGDPAACVVTFRNGPDDCGVFWVATDPRFQGRGHAKAVMTAALQAAIEDGFTTTTLQASKAGVPLYLRLGYEDLGVAVNLWQRRLAPPGA